MTQVTRPFDAVLKRIRQEITDPQPDEEVVERLLEIGLEALKNAAETKGTGNLTMNQMEAFGCAVYFYGDRMGTKFLDGTRYRGDHNRKDGSYAKGAGKDPKRGKYGRSQALHVARDHKSDYQGYELYLFNAMYYSAAHEAWGLKIITQVLVQTAHAIAESFGVDVFIDETKIYDWY